jgi:hypothetical protein
MTNRSFFSVTTNRSLFSVTTNRSLFSVTTNRSLFSVTTIRSLSFFRSRSITALVDYDLPLFSAITASSSHAFCCAFFLALSRALLFGFYRRCRAFYAQALSGSDRRSLFAAFTRALSRPLTPLFAHLFAHILGNHCHSSRAQYRYWSSALFAFLRVLSRSYAHFRQAPYPASAVFGKHHTRQAPILAFTAASFALSLRL